MAYMRTSDDYDRAMGCYADDERKRAMDSASDTVAAYREPAIMVSEPAPYLDMMDACPLCGACPGMLYVHRVDCEWWVVYLAAGKKMREALGSEEHGRSGWMWMTVGERAAVRALRPAQPAATAKASIRVGWLVVAVGLALASLSAVWFLVH